MSVERIPVKAGTNYEILVGGGLLDRAGEQIRETLPGVCRVVVVTDSNVRPLYAAQLLSSLKSAGAEVWLHEFKAGEENKTLETVAAMYEAFARAGLTRTDAVAALGGGVTGDMAGFAAATWLRGIRLVQIPTTLLSQVDSSVGGKTGVNLKSGKNLVGAFHAPRLVLIDPSTLSTLPERVFRDGMAEVIKYGCILDRALFERLEREEAGQFLEEMIVACVDGKRRIVERDEREAGERILLNFGHTLGHALEKLHGYAGLTHGEAVGIGMVKISRAGERAGLTAPGTARRIAKLLQKYKLPTEDPARAAELAKAAAQDKKRSGDALRLVLLTEIGRAFVHEVKAEELEHFID